MVLHLGETARLKVAKSGNNFGRLEPLPTSEAPLKHLGVKKTSCGGGRSGFIPNVYCEY